MVAPKSSTHKRPAGRGCFWGAIFRREISVSNSLSHDQSSGLSRAHCGYFSLIGLAGSAPDWLATQQYHSKCATKHALSADQFRLRIRLYRTKKVVSHAQAPHRLKCPMVRAILDGRKIKGAGKKGPWLIKFGCCLAAQVPA